MPVDELQFGLDTTWHVLRAVGFVEVSARKERTATGRTTSYCPRVHNTHTRVSISLNVVRVHITSVKL